MTKLSPKIEIINHFDNLINQVDIDIEQSIEKFKEDQLLGKLKCFRIKQRKLNTIKCDYYNFKYFDSNESLQTKEVIKWSKSTKVIDYLSQVRQRTIDELRKAQQENLESLKSKFFDLNQLKDSKDIEEMKSRLFADKFYFQVLYKPRENEFSWVFNLFTFVVDFYLSQSDIKFLEHLINCEEITNLYTDFSRIFDEEFFLILRLKRLFWDNLKTKKYPSHVINFRKPDLLNIKSVHSSYANHYQVNLNCPSNYFSTLESLELYNCLGIERVNIESLSSLQFLSLSISSIERVTFGNHNSLKCLYLDVKSSEINNDTCTKLFEIFPNIEELFLKGKFSNISFDSFVNLENLSINGSLLDDFNFDLFKNLCSQLTSLEISLNIDDKGIAKLFYDLNFPKISYLNIDLSKITKLERKLFDGFPNLESLEMSFNFFLKIIDHDAFSHLKQLRNLDLSINCIQSLAKGHFSELINLETLDLSRNPLKTIENNTFSNLNNLTRLDLFSNQIIEKLNPKSFVGLRNLKELYLNSDQLSYFGLRILGNMIKSNMNKIEKIYLIGNSIDNQDTILSRSKIRKLNSIFN